MSLCNKLARKKEGLPCPSLRYFNPIFWSTFRRIFRLTIQKFLDITLSELKLGSLGQVGRFIVYRRNYPTCHKGVECLATNSQFSHSLLCVKQFFVVHVVTPFIVDTNYTKYTPLTKYTSRVILYEGDNVSEVRLIGIVHHKENLDKHKSLLTANLGGFNQTRGQKNKARSPWHASTNELVAINHFPKVWTTGGKQSSQSYKWHSCVKGYRGTSLVRDYLCVNYSRLPKLMSRDTAPLCHGVLLKNKRSTLMHQLHYHRFVPNDPFLRYTSKTSTSTLLADMDNFPFFLRKHTMNANTSQKQSYEIIQHRRGLLVRIQGKFVPNRRGRPKHFPLYRHIQQYLQKVGAV